MSSRNNEEIHETYNASKSFEEERNEATLDAGQGKEEKLPKAITKVQFPVIEAGNYYLGPVVKKHIRNPVTQCLARRKGTDNYYLMKILILRDGNVMDRHHLHRRAVFHNEYSILSLLKGRPGIIQIQDFFKDSIPVEDPAEIAKGKIQLKRMCLVLECLVPHGCHNLDFISLPEYLAEKRRISEFEALRIFANLICVVDDLHNQKVVHRDLKLSNVILNRRTLQIKLINFYFAKLLSSEKELLYNQRMNSSYTAPDGISGKPVAPKPCDIWSTGVILYTMLHGYLPFIRNTSWGSIMTNTGPTYTNDFVISNDITLSDGTKRLLRGLLSKDPRLRLKPSEVIDMVSTILALQLSSQIPRSHSSDQIVPESPNFETRREPPSCSECWLIVNANAPNLTAKTYKIAISEVGGLAPIEIKTKAKDQEMEETAEEVMLKSEKEVLSRSYHGNIISRRNSVSRNNKIKFAMLRLGVTSIKNISALSFNYSDRNTSRSQL